ncbi:MAG: hypothetical protein J5889_02640, partial [Clostridia bacterium]|nr:hypothetical protein [Clostridia bacterium]
GGFVPIGSCASLAVNEEKTFTFSWKTTAYDVDVTGYVVNQATVTYDFLGSIHGTPMTSNKVYVKAGENGFIPIIDGDGEDHFDPEILHTAGDSCCALTLNYAGDGTAYYTVTLCAEHQKVLDEAKAAADTGDWAKAAELIRTALDEFYGIYYEAADEEAKAAVINERLAFYAHIGAYQTLVGDRAAAEKLMLKLVQMCCMANTAQETLPDSLVNAMTSFGMTGTEVKAGRYIGLFDGTDEVTEGYEGPDARALNDVLDLLREAKSYDFNDVFERGQILWQASLDESVNAIYKAAEREQRKLIAAWRISLDTLYHGERPFLELLYPANDAVAEEVLMNLYKDTAMDKEQIR